MTSKYKTRSQIQQKLLLLFKYVCIDFREEVQGERDKQQSAASYMQPEYATR